jgi:small multidrug resistance pump
MMKGWLYLATAILFEIMGTTAMKFSEGFSKLTPSILIFVCYFIAFTFLTLCLKTIDLSIAYAIWSGVGTGLIVIIGFFLFHEPMSVAKIFFLLLIMAGVVGLKLK